MSDEKEQTLADRIRERMDVLRLNPYSAAKRAGLGASYVRDILRDRMKSPGAEKLGALAEALETSIGYLLNGEDPTVQLRSHTPGGGYVDVPPPPPPLPGDASAKSSVLLPIRFELMANSYRAATEVTRAPFGYEAATIPHAYQDREHWYEVIRDDSMNAVAPAGSLVHVVAMEDSERNSLGHGDFVIVVSRLVMGPVHLVQRSMRRVNYRYPDLGLWFLDYASLDEEMSITDDIFRDEEVTKGAGKARDFDTAPDEASAEEIEERAARVAAALERLEATLADDLKMKDILRMSEQRRHRVVGRAIRVVRQIDPRAPLLGSS